MRNLQVSFGLRWAISLAVVTLVAVALLVAAIVRQADYARVASTDDAGYRPPPANCRLAILGDSWASGTGADKGRGGADNGYPGQLARLLGCSYQSFAGGGTGYTTGSAQSGDGPFDSRVEALIQYKPNMVLVQGSSNDYKASEGQIEAAALTVFNSIRRALPRARVYAIAVIDSPDSPKGTDAASRYAVQVASRMSGVTYINGQGWLDISRDFYDGYHPNDQGHSLFAEHLAKELTRR